MCICMKMFASVQLFIEYTRIDLKEVSSFVCSTEVKLLHLCFTLFSQKLFQTLSEL